VLVRGLYVGLDASRILAKALYAAGRVGTKVREILRRDLDPAPAQLVECLRLAGHGLKRHGIGDEVGLHICHQQQPTGDFRIYDRLRQHSGQIATMLTMRRVTRLLRMNRVSAAEMRWFSSLTLRHKLTTSTTQLSETHNGGEQQAQYI
jgi:hypothetical protein